MSRRTAGGQFGESEEEGFLGRWSRRKRDAARGAEPDEHDAARDDRQPDRGDADREDAAGAERILSDQDMPDIDSIEDDTPVAEFLSPGVSDELRRKALRKLFHSPKFNVRDGLDDFDDDYTHFAKLGDIVTADMKHRMELEAERQRERELAALEEQAPETEESSFADDSTGVGTVESEGDADPGDAASEDDESPEKA